MRLTPETTEADLQRLSDPLRRSESRRRELERVANLCVDRDIDVAVQLDATRSLCRPADGRADFEVLVSSRKHDQPHTDYPAELWDREVQLALLFHELGHVLYSDLETLGTHLEARDAQWRSLFRTVYNAAEDGAVETQMAAEFSVRDDLLVLNAALHAENDARHRDYVDLFGLTEGGDPVLTYTVYEALVRGILDAGFADSGHFAELCDPENDERVVKDGRRGVIVDLRPEIEAYVSEMLSEPDPAARVERAAEFFETVKPRFESLWPLQRTRVQTSAVRPVDAAGYDVWRPTTADRLRTAARNGALSVGGGGDGSGGETVGDAPGSVDPDAVRRAARRSVSRGEVPDGNNPYETAGERLLDIVHGDDGPESMRVVEPVEEADRERWTEAVRSARRLRDDLESRLRRERRPRRTAGERVGRLDSQRLVAAARGSQRVFTRRTGGAEKDYSCLVVLDRSGSMDGEPVEAAEAALAQLSHALFEAGVDVSVLSLWRGYVTLELPFGADPSEHVDRLLTDRSGGGTPLSDALHVARQRISRGRGAVPFVVVLTDGRPNSESSYRRELERCNAPVYGVYLGNETDHAPLFDRLLHTDADRIDTTLRRLARRLFRGGR